MTGPLISAIIPTFNRAGAVRRAIESVLCQTHAPVEVLVCDDGSTDETAAAVHQQFGARSEVKLVTLPHSGLPAVARNAGLRLARGDWVAFLDSDDRWPAQRLERQLSLVEISPDVGLVCSNARVEGTQQDYFAQVPRIGQGLLGDLLRENFIIASSVLVRRKLVDQAGGFCEDPRLRALEDYDLWLRVATCARVHYIHEPLVLYRDDPDTSLRGEISRRQHREGMELIYARIRPWARRHNAFSTEVRASLAAAEWENDIAGCHESIVAGRWWDLVRGGCQLPYRGIRRILARPARVPTGAGRDPGSAGLKLHLGCGEVYLPGDVNSDYPPSNHSVQQTSKADVYADILQLEYPPGSVQEVRLHHVFEHFQRPAALALLVRWYEWLRPGGVLILETPDVERSMRKICRAWSERKRQRILRHVFGSHEGGWATHHDGWYRAKFQSTLSRLGFRSLRFKRSSWKDTFNITVTAVKQAPLAQFEQQRAAVEQILRESLVDDSPSEVRLSAVWMDAFQSHLRPRT